MKTTVLYVGSSLLAPLRHAEGEINRRHQVGLCVAAHNFGAPLSEEEWAEVGRDLAESEVVFVIHVTDVENYLYLFCYFLQPTPANVRSMLLYALKHYAGDGRLAKVEVPPPETVPAVGIYHPEAPSIFESFEAYRRWYERRARRAERPP